MSELVFQTMHGSRLYGFDTDTSDYDYFRVTTSTATKAKHTVSHDINGRTLDTVTVGMNHFLELAKGGSHQSVEALFSQRKEYGPAWDEYGAMLNNMRVTGPEVLDKYRRTIVSFSYGDFKRRRHAVRLKFCMIYLRANGIFNPTLSTQNAEWCTNLAQKYEGKSLLGMMGLIDEG